LIPSPEIQFRATRVLTAFVLFVFLTIRFAGAQSVLTPIDQAPSTPGASTQPTTAPSATTEPVSLLTGRTLFTEAGANHYWMVTRQRDETEKQVLTLVRVTERGVGKTANWQHVARLTRSPVSIAAIDSRLAVLFGDGSWQLVWPGSVSPGPDVPAGLKLLNLAGGGQTLLGLAREADTAGVRLLEFSNGWVDLGPIPKEVGAGDMTMASLEGGWFVVAEHRGDDVFLWQRERDGGWSTLETINTKSGATGIEWLRVLGQSTPTVVIKRINEMPELFSLRQGNWTAPVTLTLPKVVSGARSSLADLTGELRLAWLDAEAGLELPFDNQGRALSKTPTVLSMPRDPAQVSAWQTAMTLAMFSLLAIALISTTWRSSPEVSQTAVATKLAPYGRRLVAGVIDALPLILTTLWIAYDAQSRGQNPSQGLTSRQELTFAVALLVYILLATVAEALTARSAGKWVMGLRVVDAQGNRPTFGRLVLRNCMRMLDIYVLPLALIFMTPLRQRLGDIASQTFVVTGSPESPSAKPPREGDEPITPTPGDSTQKRE